MNSPTVVNTEVSSLQYDRYYIEKNYRELQKMNSKASIDLSTLSHNRLKLLALKVNSVKGCHIIRVGKHDKDSLLDAIRSTLILTSRSKPMWDLTEDDWVTREIGHPHHSGLIETRFIYRGKAVLWTTCIGRESLSTALILRDWLIKKEQVNVVGFRKRQRLSEGSGMNWELKCWGLREGALEKLTQLELQRQRKLGIEPPEFYPIDPLPESEEKIWKEHFEDLSVFKAEGLNELYREGIEEAEKNSVVLVGDRVYRKVM